MLTIALPVMALLFDACSPSNAAKSPLPTAADVGFEDVDGAPALLGEAGNPDGGPSAVDQLALTPPIGLLVWDSRPGAKQYSADQDFTGVDLVPGAEAADVTALLSLRIDKPSFGTFAGTHFSLSAAPPIVRVGETLQVEGEARGKVGHARITVVRLRMGDISDVLFLTPYEAAPSPPDQNLVFSSAAGAGVGVPLTLILRNDPSNPDGFDARKLLSVVRARAEGFAKTPCASHAVVDPLTFAADSAPASLCFEMQAVTNTDRKQQAKAGFYRVFADIVSKVDSKVFDTREVIFVVPPTHPRIK
ncbi:MAG: hypothetical protein NVS3B20_02150 [Polyangiales bacterium]